MLCIVQIGVLHTLPGSVTQTSRLDSGTDIGAEQGL